MLLFLGSSLQRMLVVPPLLSKSLSALAALFGEAGEAALCSLRLRVPDAGKCCRAGLALKVTAILRVCRREGLFGFSVRNPPKARATSAESFPFLALWLEAG